MFSISRLIKKSPENMLQAQEPTAKSERIQPALRRETWRIIVWRRHSQYD